MKIIEVEWFDAQTGFADPIESEEAKDLKPLLSFSVGYLLHEDKDKVVLGFLMFDHHNSFKHWQMIPRGMIKKIKILKSKKR